jgi:hypothetical protein
MGKFPNAGAQEKKRAELETMKLKLYPVDNVDLRPGLSLARFETEAQARAELAALQKRGVRTARVVQERAEIKLAQLRLPAVDEPLKTRLADLKPLLGDKSLRSCK